MNGAQQQIKMAREEGERLNPNPPDPCAEPGNKPRNAPVKESPLTEAVAAGRKSVSELRDLLSDLRHRTPENFPRRCGSCGTPIPKGDLVLFVSAAHLSRCVSCAQAQYTASPPETVEPVREQEPRRLPAFTSARTLAKQFDPKAAQLAAMRAAIQQIVEEMGPLLFDLQIWEASHSMPEARVEAAAEHLKVAALGGQP